MPCFVGCVFLSASYWLPVASLDILLAIRLNIYLCCGLETGECCECAGWPGLDSENVPSRAGPADWRGGLAISGWAHLSWLKCRQHTAYNEIVKYWKVMTWLSCFLHWGFILWGWGFEEQQIQNALCRLCVSCFSILFIINTNST